MILYLHQVISLLISALCLQFYSNDIKVSQRLTKKSETKKRRIFSFSSHLLSLECYDIEPFQRPPPDYSHSRCFVSRAESKYSLVSVRLRRLDDFEEHKHISRKWFRCFSVGWQQISYSWSHHYLVIETVWRTVLKQLCFSIRLSNLVSTYCYNCRIKRQLGLVFTSCQFLVFFSKCKHWRETSEKHQCQRCQS